MLIRLLIRRGSVLKAKLRIVKWSLIKHVPWQLRIIIITLTLKILKILRLTLNLSLYKLLYSIIK
jgi:hypothetical protein